MNGHISSLDSKNTTSQFKCAQLLSDGCCQVPMKYFKGIRSMFLNEFYFVILTKFILQSKAFRDKIHLILVPFEVVLSQVDVVKDWILIVRMIFYLGGLRVLYQNPSIFSTNVSKCHSFLYF